MRIETLRLGGASTLCGGSWSLISEDMVVGSLLDLDVTGRFRISITAQVDLIGDNSGAIPYGSDIP